MKPKLLVIDNYDSFTYNLIQMFMLYDLAITVKRNDALTIPEIQKLKPDYILLSPGPKTPAQAGICRKVIHVFYKDIPILGVCLGMQCLNEYFSGRTLKASLPMHGKTSSINHNQQGIFSGLPNPFNAARYHSLQAVPAKDSILIIDARSKDGLVMGLSHPNFPVFGVQFHPESFLTEYGGQMVKNFLAKGRLGQSLSKPRSQNRKKTSQVYSDLLQRI